MFNIPKEFYSGDKLTWTEELTDSAVDTFALFIRGPSTLDITGIENGLTWLFEISEEKSEALLPGLYRANFVVYIVGTGRKTIGSMQFSVLPNPATVGSVDNRSHEEIELELVRSAIFKVAEGGVAEYEIGERRVRYSSLDELYKRERYLVNRIAKRKNRSIIGGRSVPIRFC